MAKSWIPQLMNVFNNADSPSGVSYPGTTSGARRPDRVRMIVGNERSLLASVYTRLAVDTAMVHVRHCRVDEEDAFVEMMSSYLNDCLTFEANIDQNAQHYMLDTVMTTLDKGYAALVPVDALVSPLTGDVVDVKTIRVGYIQEFMAQHVRVSVWNERTNQRQDVTMLKKNVGIVENPYYAVMNEPNSTLQRLNRKLMLLDMSDNRVSSGKLDLLIKFPFQVRGDRKIADAERRIEDLERQLNNSQIGVAYIDATETAIQLNRAVENKLLEQVKELRLDLFSELGLTPEILNGTADSDAIINYLSRTIEPILVAITQELQRKFISKTARTQGQRVKYFPNVFKMIPLKELAELSDKLSRNEIVTSNEFRSFLGLRPSKDPKADQLINSNNIRYDANGNPISGAPPTLGEVDTGTEVVEEPSPIDEADTLDADFEEEIDSLMQAELEGVIVHGDDSLLSHEYDPVKRREYYLRTRQLKGRKKGTFTENPKANNNPANNPTGKHRVNAIARNTSRSLTPQKAKALRQLVNQTKAQLTKLTDDFRSWVDSHPKASPKEKEAKRAEVLAKKNVAIKKLKQDAAKISASSSGKKTSTGGTEGRHH